MVQLAHQAGMNDDIKPTPAVALGAYQVTPFEIARAYTIFANGGARAAVVHLRGARPDGNVSTAISRRRSACSTRASPTSWWTCCKR